MRIQYEKIYKGNKICAVTLFRDSRAVGTIENYHDANGRQSNAAFLEMVELLVMGNRA